MTPGFFIDRPVFSTVLSVLIVIVGINWPRLITDRPIPTNYASCRTGKRVLPWCQRIDCLTSGSDSY